MLTCPFCNITGTSDPKLGRMVLQISNYYEVKLKFGKWLAICQQHYHHFLHRGKITVRASGREPYKFSDGERKQIANLVGIDLLSIQNLNIKKHMSTKLQGTLDFHIIETVKSLESDKVNFSAHDVTQRIRKKINDGEIEITGRPFQPISAPGGGTINTQFVRHEEVRDLLHSFFEQNYFHGLSRVNTGRYFEFQPVGATATVPAGSALPAAAMIPTTSAIPSLPPGTNPVQAGHQAAQALQAPVPATPTYPGLDLMDKVSAPLLRIKYKGDFLKTPTGKAAFIRRCDLTQSLKGAGVYDEFQQALKNGDAEIVKI